MDRLATVVGGLLLLVAFLLRFEITVDAHHLSTKVRPFWRRTIALSDLVATEVTIWDGQVGFFGGFSTRNRLARGARQLLGGRHERRQPGGPCCPPATTLRPGVQVAETAATTATRTRLDDRKCHLNAHGQRPPAR